ncbi:MAG: LysR substrate-binding domain-containing protein [Bryobacteraceae bacterium]|nr:LysR substrate-binding domain-containing protein [Bryobacteraceae bacterium]MDW8376957.1 LysR substrate-binding domain-containing protein [Bryobacterales bacterium]
MSRNPRSRTFDFDLWQLECFCAVARAQNFTKAARDLGISQPSLSEQIAKLERGLGGVLFERLNRKVELTPLGQAILGKAQALLEDAASLPDYFKQARDGFGGTLRVGSIPTILPYFLAPHLKAFLQRYPQLELFVREGTTAELLEQLSEGTLDLAVLSLPVNTGGLLMRELFQEPLYLVVPRDHRLAGLERISLRSAASERLLILKDGHCLREETLAMCERARARFSAQFEADQFLTIFEWIRAGFGVSVLPEMARGLGRDCRFLEIEPRAYRRVGYARLQRRHTSKAVEAFIHFLEEISRAAPAVAKQPPGRQRASS